VGRIDKNAGRSLIKGERANKFCRKKREFIHDLRFSTDVSKKQQKFLHR
jgi:hypothetical protein